MKKFLKFNFCTLEVSIKLSHLMLIQRMSNVDGNISVPRIEDETIISDNSINQVDLNSTFTASTQIQMQQYGTGFVENNNSCIPLPYITYPNCQGTCWPYFNNNYLVFPNFYTGASLYYTNRPSVNSLRSIHTSQSPDHSSRSLIKKLGMDIMSLRMWETVQEKPTSKLGYFFTLMSYNVLAQDLIKQHPYLYSNHNSEALRWSVRWKNLLKEIQMFQPDILCLQEVQESHIEKYYSQLQNLGFQGIFKKRTGGQSDGCAIYYKTDKITLLDHNLVEFFQPNVSVLNRDNVGIVAKFVPKLYPTREFVVATTHLLYNPRRSDVRLAQMHLLMTDIEKMSYKQDNGNCYYLPIIISGDLNSPPTSDLYKFITSGKVKYKHLSPALLQTQNDSAKQMLVTSCLGITDTSQYIDVVLKRSCENMVITVDDKPKEKPKTNINHFDDDGVTKIPGPTKEKKSKSKTLSHNFNLKSVYDHGKGENVESTTFQDEWLTVDYIFYSVSKENRNEKETLKLLAKYRLPTREELKGMHIPNQSVGSDHLSLIAKFKLEF